MRRKTKAIIAITLAACMTLSSTVFSFAAPYDGPYCDGESHDVDGGNETIVAVEENTIVNVTGNVTSEGDLGIQATDGAEINVNGNFSFAAPYDGPYCDGESHDVDGGNETVVAVEENTVVNVTGNVTSEGDLGVKATDGAEINVNGNIESVNSPEGEAVVTDNDGKVTVTDNVTGSAFSIMCGSDYSEASGGTVEVGGNANGTIAVYDGTVEVKGDVTGTENQSAIVTHGNSEVTIGGNVTSSGAGIETEGNSTIVIEKTLTASTSDPVILLDHSTYNEGSGFTNNPNAEESTIIVYEIKGNLNNLVKSGYSSGDFYDEGNNQYVEKTFIEDANDTLKNKQINNIFYIIKQSDGSSANINSITGSGYAMRSGYYSAPQDTALTISVKEGYGVKAGTIEVTKNADGTYTIIVPRGGGVTLTAELIQAAVDEADKEPEKQPSQPAAQPSQPAAQPSQPAAQPSQPEEKEEEEHQSSSSAQSQNASLWTSAPAQSQNASLWTSDRILMAADFNMARALDPTYDHDAYVSAFVNKIVSTPIGGTAELYVTDAAFLDYDILHALSFRRDITLKLNVMIRLQKYVITIPAGYNLDVLNLIDGKISMESLLLLFGQRQ